MIEISVSNLGHKFEKSWLFEELNFSFSEGIIGISGNNGSGKTTLIKILRGLLSPRKGSVSWVSHSTEITLNKRRQISGYAGPYLNLYEELTVEENLTFAAKMLQLSEQNDIESVLELCELSKLRSNFWKTLSSGQQQRVRLAFSVLHKPQVLFLDEPGSNLDDKGNFIVTTLINAQREKLGFLATNDAKELDLCSTIIYI